MVKALNLSPNQIIVYYKLLNYYKVITKMAIVVKRFLILLKIKNTKLAQLNKH